jgi:hypothetical protein
MNATAARPSLFPQAQVSAAARLAAAIAVAAVTAVAWLGAEQASHHAVRSAAQAISSAATHVTLPPVQVVGRREAPRRT